jgi:hypothetical protein
MRTMMKQLTMGIGCALLMAVGSVALGHRGSLVEHTAVAAAELQSPASALSRRPSCPICGETCC